MTHGTEDSRLEKLGSLIRIAQAPVEFYGKIVDQDGVPIPGVCVVWSVGKAGYFASQPDTRGESFSDSVGMFSVSNQRGRALQIDSMKKEGYRESKGGSKSFSFGDNSDPHIPDPKKPVIFLMIKDNLPKNQFSEEQEIHLIWNGEPNRIKLIGQDSMLIVTATRDRNSGQIDGFSWSMDISIAGGKVFELAAGAALLAPVDGYVENIRFGFQANEAGWQAGGDKNVVFKTKDGNYGIVCINFYTNREDGRKSLYVKSTINLSGHRNL